jgi:TrmH family RNA methyltransferase
MKIIEIEGRENKRIKELNKLKLKKYREQCGEFVVENWKIIQDALISGSQPRALFMTKDFFNKNKFKVEELFGESENIFILSERININFSSLDSPQGVWAVYASQVKAIDFNKDIIYLNGINDPGNLGTILRSALALGVENIVLDETCVDVYNPKTIQSAKDAIFKLNIVFDQNRKIAGEIKGRMEVMVTNVEKGASVCEIFQTGKNVCIVLGSESWGVSKELNAMADKFINIKTTSKIESLNVAISAGIIFHELFKSKIARD